MIEAEIIASASGVQAGAAGIALAGRTVADRRPVLRGVSTVIAAIGLGYAVAIPSVFESKALDPDHVAEIAPWIAVPAQILAVLSIGCVLLGRPQQRRPWLLVLAYTALNICAAFAWNSSRPNVVREEMEFCDWLYVIDYWLLAAAFALLYRRSGGAFRSVRLWLDAATMIAVQMVALWSFCLAPTLPRGFGQSISVAATSSYALTLSCLMSMAALLCLQQPSLRHRRAVLLLVAAAMASVAWEVTWLASWLVDEDFVGAYYNYGDVLGFVSIAGAACVAQYEPLLDPSESSSPQGGDSFLPALAVLLATALVAGTLATTRRPETWLLVALVSLCAILLVTRQSRVQRELRALNRRLAARAAEERLTELVRRSSDLIVVVGPGGAVSFASPAAADMLAGPVGALQGATASTLFGPAHAAALETHFSRVIEGADAPDQIELRVERGPHDVRVFKIIAVNQLDNALIGGLVLTIQDVTEQRALELEVLDVAARERTRLSGDIHDGLGQELTGIALLLQVAATNPDPDPERQRRHLEAILGQVERTIAATRDLARGLSPLRAVVGSFPAALRRLAGEFGPQIPVMLDIDPLLERKPLDGVSADHLYRIVQEAVTNALRHSGGTHIHVELRGDGDNLVLTVADDGAGIPPEISEELGLGLRLMEYRARLLGGSLRVTSLPGDGTRIEVTLPLSYAAAAPGL